MRVMVCDDHAMFLEALADALTRLGHEVVATTTDLDEVAALVGRSRPDAVLIDLWFDDRPSLPVARRLAAGHPEARLVLLTADVSPEALAALDEGVVQAVAHKSWGLALIDQTLTRVASGSPVRRLLAMPSTGTRAEGPRLTGRELQVLRLMSGGASTTEMRLRLGVSEHTVRSHVRSLLAKLGVHTRVEAVRRAHDHGLVRARAGGVRR